MHWTDYLAGAIPPFLLLAATVIAVLEARTWGAGERPEGVDDARPTLATKPKSIRVNGRRFTEPVRGRWLYATYEDVVRTSGIKGAVVVTYHRGAGRSRGTLRPREWVGVVDGMVFTVVPKERRR